MNLQWRSLAIPVKKAPRPVLGYLSETELAHGLAQIDRLDAGRRRRRRRRRPPLHQATRSSRPGLRGCDGVGAVVRRERHRARRRGAVRLDDAIVGLTPCPQPAPATPPGSRLDGAGPFSLPGGGVSWSLIVREGGRGSGGSWCVRGGTGGSAILVLCPPTRPRSDNGPSAVPSINIRTIGELVSSRESFHAAKKVHRSTHSPGTRGLSRDAPQAQREQRESAPRSGSLEGRCGRAGVDRRADRRRLFVPHQDRREHSPTMRAARVRAGAGTKTAGVPPDPETAQRRTGGSHHRPASGAAPEGLRELVVAPAGAAGRRVGDHRVDQPRNHPADAKKTG